jgi:hypothetical protein
MTPLKRQAGWALACVVLLSGTMAAATLGVALDMVVTQSGSNQRQALLHAQAAAEALLRLAPLHWSQAPAAPANGCARGRCTWMGDAGLNRDHWSAWLDGSVPEGGWSGSTPWVTHWPTLPQARLSHWVESTPSTDGMLLRITARVDEANGRPLTVMQAIWRIDPTGLGGQWVSWREVMP